jgi:hypothetical protein
VGIAQDRIVKIEVTFDAHGNQDVTFYYDSSDEPFNAGEFEPDTVTRRELEAIERAIARANKIME